MEEEIHNKKYIGKKLDKFLAKYFDRIPDWRNSINRITDIPSETSVITLVMLHAVLLFKFEVRKSIIKESCIYLEDKILRDCFENINPLPEISFSKAGSLCRDTDFFYCNGHTIVIREGWDNAFLDYQVNEALEEYIKVKIDKVVDEYINVATFTEQIQTLNEFPGQVTVNISKDGKILHRVSKNVVGEYVVPDDILVIGSGAFADCSHLTRVVLNEKLVRIDSGAFRGCSALLDIEVPETVMKIGTDAFKGTSINNQYTDQLYKLQGCFTPADVSILFENNVLVYRGEKDRHTAIKYFNADPKIQSSHNGRSIAISKDFSSNDYETEVAEFISYAKKHPAFRFVVVPSAYGSHLDSKISEAWFEAKDSDNITLPKDLYLSISELENNDTTIDEFAKYKVGGIINFSYEVNAIKGLSDEVLSKILKKQISEYNRHHVKDMLVSLSKHYNTGISIHPNDGLYVGEDNQFYDEKSFEAKIIGISSHQLENISKDICLLFFQESVLVKDEIKDKVYLLYSPPFDLNNHIVVKAYRTITELANYSCKVAEELFDIKSEPYWAENGIDVSELEIQAFDKNHEFLFRLGLKYSEFQGKYRKRYFFTVNRVVQTQNPDSDYAQINIECLKEVFNKKEAEFTEWDDYEGTIFYATENYETTVDDSAQFATLLQDYTYFWLNHIPIDVRYFRVFVLFSDLDYETHKSKLDSLSERCNKIFFIE